MRRWSPTRVASSVVLGIWAVLFWFLLVTERTSLYLSPRTAWVVPLGGVICTIAAVGQLVWARSGGGEPIRARHAFGMLFVAFPAVVVLALEPAALGAFAADRRSSFVSSGFTSSVEDVATGELTLIDVAGALRSSEAMSALAQRAGEDVAFVGFVTRDGSMSADEFVLTRFLVSCCVADALSVQVRVVGAPPGEPAEDQWVSVEGKIYPVGREVIVDATEVAEVERPKHPYLSP